MSIPLVCPSFASKDLSANSVDGKMTDKCGTDESAGHDPWSICDYIRDYLKWPTESMFLDSECFGYYCHPR
jgi:hypothetical protein